MIFIKGAENVPRNDVLAVKYLKKAVDGGDTTAALNLGKMCEVGRAGKSFFKNLFCVELDLYFNRKEIFFYICLCLLILYFFLF